jgi:hypothetical protein
VLYNRESVFRLQQLLIIPTLDLKFLILPFSSIFILLIAKSYLQFNLFHSLRIGVALKGSHCLASASGCPIKALTSRYLANQIAHLTKQVRNAGTLHFIISRVRRTHFASSTFARGISEWSVSTTVVFWHLKRSKLRLSIQTHQISHRLVSSHHHIKFPHNLEGDLSPYYCFESQFLGTFVSYSILFLLSLTLTPSPTFLPRSFESTVLA